jgi:hypothetical protein
VPTPIRGKRRSSELKINQPWVHAQCPWAERTVFRVFIVLLCKTMTEVVNYRKTRGSRRKFRRPRHRFPKMTKFPPIRKQDTGVFNPYSQGLWGSLIANFSYTFPLTRITNGVAEYQRGNDCRPIVMSTVGEFIIYQEVSTLCTYRFIGVTTHSPYVMVPNVPQLNLLYNLINPVTILTGPTKRRQDQDTVLFNVWHDTFVTNDTNNGCQSQIRKISVTIPSSQLVYVSNDTHGDSGTGMQFIVMLTDAPVANANYSVQFNAIRTFRCTR